MRAEAQNGVSNRAKGVIMVLLPGGPTHLDTLDLKPDAPAEIRGGEQRITTVGVNWFMNPALKLMLHYQHVNIDRLNPVGVEIGQTYDAVAARAQVSF